MAAQGSIHSPSNSHSQDTLSLQVSLPQMLDLALGTPQVGAVNLNILHNFLHVLLHQIDLSTTKVEYRGDEANRIKRMITSSIGGPSLEFHEYNIIDASGNTIQRTRGNDTGMKADVYTESRSSEKVGKPATSAPDTAREKSGIDGSQTTLDGANGAALTRKTSGMKQQIGSELDGKRQSVIFIEPVFNGATPTALGFKRLDNSVRELEQKFRVLDELANNSEMIERVKSNVGDPLSDMWHGINVNKRLDASEQGIEKLTTMVQDLIKSDKNEFAGGGIAAASELGELGHLNERIVELENNLAYLGGDVSKLKSIWENLDDKIREAITEAVQEGSSEITFTRAREAEGRFGGMENVGTPAKKQNGEGVDENRSSNHRSMVDKAKKEISATSTRRSVIGGVDLSELQNNVKALRSEMTIVQKNVQDLSMKIVHVVTRTEAIDTPRSKNDDTIKSAPAADSTAARSADAVTNAKDTAYDETSATSARAVSQPSVVRGLRVTGIDQSASSSHVAIAEVDGAKATAGGAEAGRNKVVNSSALDDLSLRVVELEKGVACVIKRINKEFGTKGSSRINDLVAKIQAIEIEMEKINNTASCLMEEKASRGIHTDTLVEQIELLKAIKADKEDLEDALADKADAHAVNRKVSHDQFDAACDDLARNLEDAITKLSQQESVWQRALDEVQREIEGKLDKIEISPLKEFVNNRLKVLQERLKALAEMRRENEAAGTKKMLSDVQCISCDANAVMRMEEGAQYRAPALPGSKSMKPYLTYELDQVRKQQRRLPHSRNMIQFEAVVQEMSRKANPLKGDPVAKSPRDHLCSRYCGGSHTITTPQQRVMRMGHFLTQWGPEAIQLGEGVVLGTDGHPYRGRSVLGKPDVSVPFGSEGSVGILPSSPPVLEPAILPMRKNQINQRRSNTLQESRRLSERKPSERMKETVEQKIEEIPVEPSAPPSAPPATIVDEDEVVLKPLEPANEVVREETSQGENQTPEKLGRQDSTRQGQKDGQMTKPTIL